MGIDVFDAISAEVQYRHQRVGLDWRKGEPVLRRLLRSLRGPAVRPAQGTRSPRVAIGRAAVA